MPLPRFARLPAERRARILAVAREHLAKAGTAASYNQVIADAGISKASAYQYFDGKEDLIQAVVADLHQRLGDVLGPWQPAASKKAFWTQLDKGSDAMLQHLHAHPEDLALLLQLPSAVDNTSRKEWIDALLKNGLALGLISKGLNPLLLRAATAGVLNAIDQWALASLAGRQPVSLQQGWSLLRSLWSAPAGGSA